MKESENSRAYEFTGDQNRVLKDLSRGLRKLGIAILMAGSLSVVYMIVSFLDPVSLVDVSDTRHFFLANVDYALWTCISLLVMYLSITIIRLARPLKLITTTAGTDISFLMDFIERLTRICHLSFRILIVVCLLLIISFVMMVLVF